MAPDVASPRATAHARLALAWAAVGHLALLGLCAVFPRYFFNFGPVSPWPALLCLATIAVTAARGTWRDARDLALDLSGSARMRRAAAMCALPVLLASVAVWTKVPAGVTAELAHPDGTVEEVGKRADFDLDRREYMALATYPKTSVHMKGFFIPGWTPPWAPNPHNVLTRCRIVGAGAFDLALNRHNRIRVDNTTQLEKGVVRIADLAPQGDAIDLRFEPGGTQGDGRFRVAIEGEQFAWHLFLSPVSVGGFWLVGIQRVLLGLLVIIGAPLAGVTGSRVLSRLLSQSRFAPRLPALREATAVVAVALAYVCWLSPRVETSACGDRGAFINWADYLERGQIVQPAPDWIARWAGPEVGAYVSLALHVALPNDTRALDSASHRIRLVDAKPVGLPLIVLAVRSLFGEESGYSVSAWMAASGAAVLYAAARVSGLGVILSLIGAASLAFSEEYTHSALVLDPDAATTAWISLLVLGLLLVHRARGWAVLAGASFGMACLTRYNAALALLLIGPFLWRWPRRIAPFLVGGAPFLLTMLVVNRRTYGSFFQFPYTSYATDLMGLANPYWKELLGYVREFIADLSPVVWIPFLAFPFVKQCRRRENVALAIGALGWVAFFGRIAKVDAHFLRYLLPIYPAVILTGLQVWRWLSSRTARQAQAVLPGVVALTGAWLVPRALAEDPEPPDASRVAASWVDYRVPPEAGVLTDQLVNNALYYYLGHRRFPITLHMPRSPGTDLIALKRGARSAGDWEDWYVLLGQRELEGFRTAYPEVRLEEIRSAQGWQLFRVAAIGGSD
jgi:hypothetical protein